MNALSYENIACIYDKHVCLLTLFVKGEILKLVLPFEFK